MIKYFLFLIISFSLLQSETFEERQKTLQDVKNIIQYEESVARTYERYILDNYKLPSITNINTLLGGSITSVVTTISSNITLTSLTSGLTKLSYALGDTLKADDGITNLYDSSIFRKRTYVRDGSVYFILEDIFAKHVFDLIALNNNSNKEIKACSTSNSDRACLNNDHIYIDATLDTAGDITGYLMSYHMDKFESGPIIITKETSKHTDDIFKSVPKGVLFYDTSGIKYVKTTSGLEVLQ